ncbi:MAG: preprotein translocase subunit YajC [Alphaproteobacteria bacterium]|nr:preprotein translocase subunit YajC [Alphaproteobacteria bacterium]
MGQELLSALPMLVVLLTVYAVLVWPQQRRRARHRRLVAGIALGDRVTVSGGIHGVIVALADKLVTIEIAPGTRIEIERDKMEALDQPAAANPRTATRTPGMPPASARCLQCGAPLAAGDRFCGVCGQATGR